MSADHRRPLYAFVVVGLLCVLIIVNALRSSAAVLDVIQAGAEQVIPGISFQALQHVQPTEPPPLRTPEPPMPADREVTAAGGPTTPSSPVESSSAAAAEPAPSASRGPSARSAAPAHGVLRPLVHHPSVGHARHAVRRIARAVTALSGPSHSPSHSPGHSHEHGYGVGRGAGVHAARALGVVVHGLGHAARALGHDHPVKARGHVSHGHGQVSHGRGHAHGHGRGHSRHR